MCVPLEGYYYFICHGISSADKWSSGEITKALLMWASKIRYTDKDLPKWYQLNEHWVVNHPAYSQSPLPRTCLIKVQTLLAQPTAPEKCVPFYALATPRPRQPDKIMPDGARQKIAGSIWFPGPKIWRKIEGSWPDWARQHQILSLFVNKVKFWRCLVQSGQLPSSFLQTFGPGSQTEPATFSSGSVWHDFVWLSGLGVASP